MEDQAELDFFQYLTVNDGLDPNEIVDNKQRMEWFIEYVGYNLYGGYESMLEVIWNDEGYPVFDTRRVKWYIDVVDTDTLIYQIYNDSFAQYLLNRDEDGVDLLLYLIKKDPIFAKEFSTSTSVNGFNPFQYAVGSEQHDLISILIKHGVYYPPAVARVIKNKEYNMLNFLINHGILPGGDSITAAIDIKNWGLVKRLIKMGVSPIDNEYTDDNIKKIIKNLGYNVFNLNKTQIYKMTPDEMELAVSVIQPDKIYQNTLKDSIIDTLVFGTIDKQKQNQVLDTIADLHPRFIGDLLDDIDNALLRSIAINTVLQLRKEIDSSITRLF